MFKIRWISKHEAGMISCLRGAFIRHHLGCLMSV
jgi:hypothetical protein